MGEDACSSFELTPLWQIPNVILVTAQQLSVSCVLLRLTQLHRLSYPSRTLGGTQYEEPDSPFALCRTMELSITQGGMLAISMFELGS